MGRRSGRGSRATSARGDEAVLKIGELDGKLRLRLLAQGPPPETDATGIDRVLVLDFAFPVDAADVLSSVQEGIDTDD